MGTARAYHTSALLDNGQVLIVGGNNTENLASAELYDPTTGTFKATGTMTAKRTNHTMTPLPDRKVLIVGGTDLAPGADLYFY
jgi:hypothetical protein